MRLPKLYQAKANPENVCPVCKELLDDCLGLQDESLEPGDISLCIYCGEVLIFNDDLSLRLPKDKEWKEIKEACPADENVRIILEMSKK